MAGLADFHADARREFGGNAQPRAENLQDERIARPDELHASAHANPHGLKTLRVLVISADAAHHGADARRQFIEPHGGGGLVNGCHNDDKISFPAFKSNGPPPEVDAGGMRALISTRTLYQSQSNATAGKLRFVVGELRPAADGD